MRAALTGVLAVVLGVWTWLEQEQVSLYSRGVYEALHSTWFQLLYLAFVVLVVAVVNRYWVALAVLGSFAILAYLQLIGYRSEWHDGNAPLSLPTVFGMVASVVLLLLLVGARRILGKIARFARNDGDLPPVLNRRSPNS